MISTLVSAQPVLQSGDISYVPGEAFVEHTCPWIDPGPGGADQVWNFGALDCPNTWTNTWIAPFATMNEDWPTTTVVWNSQSRFEMYEASTDAFRALGFSEGITLTSARYDDPSDEIRYPFTYGDSYTDTWNGWNYFPDGTGGQDSSAVSGTLAVEADGHGTLILPFGTIEDVLRIHKVRQFPGGTGTTTVEEYRYYAVGTHHPWFHTYRSSNSGSPTVVERARYLAQTGAGVDEATRKGPLVHLAQGRLMVKMPDTRLPVHIELLGADGRSWQQWSGATVQRSELSLALAHTTAGACLVRITDADGRSSTSRHILIH